MNVNRGIWALAMIISMGGRVAGQVTTATAQSFPFSACGAVATDGNKIYAGSGGGVFALVDTTSGSPNPVLDTTFGVESRMRPLGFTRDLSLTASGVYVASGHRGLVRFQRPNHQPPTTNLDQGQVGNAVTVDAIAVGTQYELIFVGSQDFNGPYDNGVGTGKLSMATWDTTHGLQLVATVTTLDSPVFALATWIHGTTLTLLVGTACRGDATNPGASLFRYDFTNITSGPPTSIPSPTTSWVATSLGSNVLAIIRDIVIDPATNSAYVAAYGRGLYKFDISSGLMQSTATGWPITTVNGRSPVRFTGLTLHKPTTSETLLLANMGKHYPEWGLAWGTCFQPGGCTEPSGGSDSAFEGIAVYNVSSSSPSLKGQLEAGIGSGELPKEPIRLATQAINGNSFRVDVADFVKGFQVVSANRVGSTWALAWSGQGFDSSDGYPQGTVDDVIRLGDHLVASFENGVIAYDATLAEADPDDPAVLQDFQAPALAGAGAVLVEGVDDLGGGFSPTFFSHTDTKLLAYELHDGSGGTSITYQGSFDTRGDGYICKVYPASITPDGRPWLVVVNSADTTTASSPPYSGGIRIYALEDLNSDGHVDLPAEKELIAVFAPHLSPPGATGLGHYLDCELDFPGASTFSIWITYGPLGTVVPTAGLLVLEGRYDITGGVWLNYIGRVESFTSSNDPYPGDPTVSRLTRDGDRLYGAFGCHGIAAYTVAGPGDLPTQSSSDIWTGPIPGVTALHAVHGAGDNVFVAFLNEGIRVFDGSDLSAGEKMKVQTEFLPVALLEAPATYPEIAFYVADGVGGLYRLVFSDVP